MEHSEINWLQSNKSPIGHRLKVLSPWAGGKNCHLKAKAVTVKEFTLKLEQARAEGSLKKQVLRFASVAEDGKHLHFFDRPVEWLLG